MYKFFMIFLLFALSACEGGGGGVRGSTRPDAVLPNVVLNVATDNSVIQLEVGDGGSFDRLDMFYCGSGSVDADADCKPLSSGTLRSFTFTQVHALDYEGSSGGNSLKKDAAGGAEGEDILTSVLSGATTYTFKFDAFKADGNTNVGDTDSSMMSAVTHDTDNLLRVNVPYARISHDVSSFDTSFDVMDAVRDVQMSYRNTAMYRRTFDDMFVKTFETKFYHDAGCDSSGLPVSDDRNKYICEQQDFNFHYCRGVQRVNHIYSCKHYADVQVSIPGRWMWNSESAVNHAAPDDHPEVACTYTRPENYIMGIEPLLTNAAISAEVAGGNDRSFYGFDASDVDTTLLFTDEDSDTSSDNTLNEDLAFTTNDDGERVFEFDSAYMVDENTEQVSFTPSGNLFRRSSTPVRIRCYRYRKGFGSGREVLAPANIDPASIYQPFPVSANKTVRTITYRVPQAASFIKPASASFGVLPHTRSGFQPSTSVNNSDYILYNFYDGFSDSYFNNRVALTIPDLLLNAPLSVTSQHEEEARYQLKVINQYTDE